MTMEAPLRHINCRNLTLESADKLTNMFSRIQDTTYFAVFLQPIQGSNPAICFCYFNPFMPTGAFNICCPRDCVSRHNGGTSGAPLKPL